MTELTSILQDYRILGLVIGLATFLIIGLFHPIVIKSYYYLGTRSWWIFLIAAGCLTADVPEPRVLPTL